MIFVVIILFIVAHRGLALSAPTRFSSGFLTMVRRSPERFFSRFFSHSGKNLGQSQFSGAESDDTFESMNNGVPWLLEEGEAVIDEQSSLIRSEANQYGIALALAEEYLIMGKKDRLEDAKVKVPLSSWLLCVN